MDLQLDQLRTLRAISDTGSFESAAHQLNITPSAVSQRIRTLESAAGRIVLVRSKPIELTDSGQRLLRLARQIELLHRETLDELQPDDQKPHIPIVVNSDSLATWALEPLVAAADYARIEVLREDQSRSLGPLHNGEAMAAVTSIADPVPGCHVHSLGNMRYFACAAPDFVDRWFPSGISDDAFALAPMVVFDRKDDLQDDYLHMTGRTAPDTPRNFIPSTTEFLRSIELGLGWGTVPELQCAQALDSGRLVQIEPQRHLDVPLYWQQWRLRSNALSQVAESVREAAEQHLLTLSTDVGIFLEPEGRRSYRGCRGSHRKAIPSACPGSDCGAAPARTEVGPIENKRLSRTWLVSKSVA